MYSCNITCFFWESSNKIKWLEVTICGTKKGELLKVLCKGKWKPFAYQGSMFHNEVHAAIFFSFYMRAEIILYKLHKGYCNKNDPGNNAVF